MKRGKLWCHDEGWMREVVWLQDPNMAQCEFQSTQGETIILNDIAKITLFKDGDQTIDLKDGRTFILEKI
jgi:hypothetical protein